MLPKNFIENSVKKTLARSGVLVTVSQSDLGRYHVEGDVSNQPFTKKYSLPLRIGEIIDDYVKAANIAERLSVESISLASGNILDLVKGVFKNEDSQEIARLTEKESDILKFLLSCEGYKASKQKLLNDVWGYNIELETHTLETHIYRLRQKIEPNPDMPVNLITIEDGYALKVI